MKCTLTGQSSQRGSAAYGVPPTRGCALIEPQGVSSMRPSLFVIPLTALIAACGGTSTPRLSNDDGGASASSSGGSSGGISSGPSTGGPSPTSGRLHDIL